MVQIMTTLNLTKDAPLLDLAKTSPQLKTLKSEITWLPHPVHGASLTQGFDLDLFAFVLNADSKITSGSDVVFFNNKTYGNAIVLPEDNRTGGSEYCNYTLANLPATVCYVDIFCFIHEAAQRNQSFAMLTNAKFTLIDSDTNAVIQQYRIDEFNSDQSALYVGRLSRTPSGWTFNAIGAAASVDPNQVARTYM